MKHMYCNKSQYNVDLSPDLSNKYTERLLKHQVIFELPHQESSGVTYLST